MATKTKTAPLVEFKKLKVGEALCETQWYKVVKISGNQVQLCNDNGEDIVVDNGYVESCLISASQFTETQNVNMTLAADLLLQNPSTCITVNWNTKVDAKAVVAEIQKAYQNSTPVKAEAAITAAVKKGLEGEERTIVGRHYGKLNDLGRLAFIDMDVVKDTSKGYDNRIRQVDPRTLNWLVIKGVKYSVK